MTPLTFLFYLQCRASLKENGLIYGIGLLVALPIFIYAIKVKGLAQAELAPIMIAISNTWGIVAVVMMLGYGLVDVPRSLWQASNYNDSLLLSRFKVAQISSEKTESEGQLSEVKDQIMAMNTRIEAKHELRSWMDMLMSKMTPDTRKSLHYASSEEEDRPVTLKSLVELHKILLAAQRFVNRCDCMMDEILDEAFLLEDIVLCRDADDGQFIPSIASPKSYTGRFLSPKAVWWWKVKLGPYLYKLAALIAAIFSIIIVWSELVLSSDSPVLSITALMIGNAGKNNKVPRG